MWAAASRQGERAGRLHSGKRGVTITGKTGGNLPEKGARLPNPDFLKRPVHFCGVVGSGKVVKLSGKRVKFCPCPVTYVFPGKILSQSSGTCTYVPKCTWGILHAEVGPYYCECCCRPGLLLNEMLDTNRFAAACPCFISTRSPTGDTVFGAAPSRSPDPEGAPPPVMEVGVWSCLVCGVRAQVFIG